jgi:hypothetical protein
VDGAVAYGVVGVGEGLAAAVVGVGQAVEFVIGVGDDTSGDINTDSADDADAWMVLLISK